MRNCGLPKGYEDQCCLNHIGMCTLDTADYSEIDRATKMRGCGFIGVNDRYLMWKYGVPYKDFICGNCQHYEGETHGECSNEKVKPHTKGITVNGEKTYIDSKEYYSGAHACKEFKKQEEVRKVAKQTYWTKCGREFQKNSTAVVTGYEIDVTDKDCAECPFQVDVKEGWPQVHKRWECRAGSEKPNHTTDWTGSLEDKNTININSLDNAFMESVIEYCNDQPDVSASYNADHLADCRRTLTINCSSNKKGIAAKKELIEKFFPNKLCSGCSYWPVKGSTICNHIGNDNEVNESTQRCEHYWNPREENMEEEPVSETKENVIELTQTASNTPETVSFDYARVDTDTADFLQDKAEKIATIRLRSVMAIGKELKEAHGRLASYDKTKGTFTAWVKSIGISWDTANNYIRAFNYVSENFGMIESAEQIQPSLLFAISKPSAPQELQDAVLAGDITTHKEYQELLQAKKDAEFHYERSRESYKRLEKVNTEHYQKRVQAEEKIQELQAQINALSKSKTDPNEILMLKNTIKQYEDEVYELNQQLFSAPIEAQAATIKEVVPPEIQAELQRLTTENRLLSEKQTSTTRVIESIVQGSSEIRGQLEAYNAITKTEIREMKDVPKTVMDAVYALITDLRLYAYNFESITKQIESKGGEN